MARQTEKLSDKFKSGGSKHGDDEQLFFAATSRIDPEWAVIDLLRSQLETITDVVNANDAGSGSFATATNTLTSASSSFSTRVTANDAKTVLVVGTGSGNAKAGNTTTISSAQASAITANTAKVGMTVTEGYAVAFTVLESRGVYSLRFDVTGGKINGTISSTVALR